MEYQTLYPDYNGNSIYNLSQAVFEHYGIKSRSPMNNINLKKKNLIIILDAFGYNIFSRFQGDIEHRKITSIFPTTTCTVMTTITTSLLPGEHEIIGYLGYDERKGKITNLLEFFNRSEIDEDSMDWIFSKIKNIKIDANVGIIVPFYSMNVPLLNALTKPYESYYYVDISDALSLVNLLVKKNKDLIFLYIPHIDIISHFYGPSSEITLNSAKEIFERVYKFSLNRKNDMGIIITADHGQIDVESIYEFPEEIYMMNRMPILGDVRMHIFFKDMKMKLQNYRVLNDSEMERLLGKIPEKFSGFRFGLSLDKKSYITTLTEPETRFYRGHHSSILREEMEIPLINL